MVKFSSNDIFWILVFIYFSSSAEKTNTFIRSRGSLENHTRFKTILFKPIPVFRPKRLKNHTLWGGTYLYSLYRGAPSPPPGTKLSFFPYACTIIMSIHTRSRQICNIFSKTHMCIVGGFCGFIAFDIRRKNALLIRVGVEIVWDNVACVRNQKIAFRLLETLATQARDNVSVDGWILGRVSGIPVDFFAGADDITKD